MLILNWLNDNFDHLNCYTPEQIYSANISKITPDDLVVETCRRLHARKLIDEMTSQPGDSLKRRSCYRISQLGIDKLNPNTREKNLYKIAIIAMAAAIIAAIASIISIFT